MNIEFSPEKLQKALFKFIRRYHIVMFVVLVMGGMAVVMFMLNNTIQSSTSSDNMTPVQSATRFDQDTIDKLESLNMTSGNTKRLDFPSGRINPFTE